MVLCLQKSEMALSRDSNPELRKSVDTRLYPKIRFIKDLQEKTKGNFDFLLNLELFTSETKF